MKPNLLAHELKEYKKFIIFLQIFIFYFFLSGALRAQAPVDPSSIIGKVVCGYQCWFTCTGDGSPVNQWTHWSPANPPQAGIAPNPNPNLTFDLIPMFPSITLPVYFKPILPTRVTVIRPNYFHLLSRM